MITVIQKSYKNLTLNQKEILRYMGVKTVDAETQKLVNECVAEFCDNAVYRVCYTEIPVEQLNDGLNLGGFKVISKDLVISLKGCKRVVIFAATVGIGVDRLINKYTRISPARAVVLDAVGSEGIEALCNCFCDELKVNFGALRPRFSAGYGDLPIEVQAEIFLLLQCGKNIGLTLNDSYIMSPSKSVTAFVGILND